MPILERASNFTISGYARLYEVHGDAVINQITETTMEPKKVKSIANLPRAQASRRDYQISKKSGPCFEGTRVAILREMIDWVIIPSKSRIYALSGLAGIGKSTVAYTVAAQADYRGLLGASFFFSRDEADRRTVKKFFTTLAYQLCLYDEEFAEAIGEVLVTERGSFVTTLTPQEQLEALILKPLRRTAASNGRPILVVVDALDECDIDDAPSVLAGLRLMVQDLPAFKVILTTRPQPLVSNDFTTLRGHKIFHLQDIEDRIINDDIRLYLKHNLSPEQVKARLQDPTEDWCASGDEIESLVHAAGKLFIIASTAILFILDKAAGDPEGRMIKLLRAFAQDHTPFKVLHNFYSVILRNAVPEDCDDDIVERYQSVIGTIVVIQTPLPIAPLARLIGRRVKELHGALRNLQSVILLGSDNVPHIYHKSFSDYITDSARCKDINLRIDPRTHHTLVAIYCFSIMDGHLRHNIFLLDGPARFMDNKAGLTHQGISDGQLLEEIPPELRYACIYWADHLEGANIEDARLMEGMKKFTDVHMLHWFEALSLIGRLDSAQHSIRIALRLMKPISSESSQLLTDGLRFISKFYELIEKSALHTYYSALPFTPTGSPLYRRYNKESVDSICRVIGGPQQHDALLATPHWRNFGSSLKFSLDSTTFALCDGSKSVKFWDAATGIPISTIPLSPPCHVAIADTFSTIASAKENIVTLYSVKSSSPVATFTTSAQIWSLAFSSENNRIATWLEDGTICLWDSGKGTQIANCSGYDVSMAVFAFSPTGGRLVRMPFDGGIIHLLDGINGELIANLDHRSKKCYELIFSFDGSRFVVLTKETVELRESESGELVGLMNTPLVEGAARQKFEHSNERVTLAISTNGSLLAIGYNTTVQLWSGSTGNPLTLTDELGFSPRSMAHSPASLAFSTDGLLAFATDSNITVYDVRNCSVISTLSFYSQESKLTFSPDCTRLAAINYNGSIHLWDVQNMRAPSNSSSAERANLGVTLAKFSQDCLRLACRLEDNTVELWDVSTKRRVPLGHWGRPFSFGFSPDSKRFAALFNKTIRLWDSEDGVPTGSVNYSSVMVQVALSNRMLAACSMNRSIIMWDLKTLHLIGTVKLETNATRLSFSNNGDLLAYWNGRNGALRTHTVTVLDVMTHTTIATCDIPDLISEVDFLPGDSQLVAQRDNGDFQSFNLISGEVTYGPTFDHLVQLRQFPLWHGIPVWVPLRSVKARSCLVGLFPGHKDPVPVLWIPTDLQIEKTWTQASSMVALLCGDEQVIFAQSSEGATV